MVDFLVLGSERDLGADHMDHLRDLSASADQPEVQGKEDGRLCDRRYDLCDLHLCRGQSADAGAAFLRLICKFMNTFGYRPHA